ncbi:MAG: hypothetical protein Q9215_000901 [Flavoplaca cf. flavocitrina]
MSSTVFSPTSPKNSPQGATTSLASSNGDLNNISAVRPVAEIAVDAAFVRQSLAIQESDDDPEIRRQFRPFLLRKRIVDSDWVTHLEISTAMRMAYEEMHRPHGTRLKVLVLYGSLRERLGCDVRVFNPAGLPVKDDLQHSHPKVQELRGLSRWSDGHVWVSPEQHGSVRPTQGRTLAIAQVSGGSQSFNTVNSLRILGRWMRMFTIPNQSSVPMAYKQFTDEEDAEEGESRLMPGGHRDRLVDCMEEFVKYSIVMRPHFDLFSDRYSERTERMAKGVKLDAKPGASPIM